MDETTEWYSARTATFGDRVAGAREAIGLTQPELARRLGIKVKTLRDWENDVSEPRANKLQMLSGVLAVSLMWLLNGEGDGIDAPQEGGDKDILRDILGEIRATRSEMDALSSRLGRLEGRLAAATTEAPKDE